MKRSVNYGRARAARGVLNAALIAAALALIAMPAVAEPHIGGMVRSSTAVNVDEELDLELIRNMQTLRLDLSARVGNADMVATPVLDVTADGGVDIDLREAWVELFFPSADVRIGKQQIVWGEADGAFITDIVSPRDLTDFILPDFEEIRIGVPAAKIDWYAGPFTAQAVWVPEFVPNRMPPPGSYWSRTPDFSGMPIEPDIDPTPQLPDRTLENSEIIGKLSYFSAAVNAEIMAAWAWDSEPVLSLEPTFSAPGVIESIEGTPTYERMFVTGGSFSTTLGPLVWRNEAALYFDRSFNTTDPFTDNAIAEHTQLHYLGGLDWALAGADMSAQWIVNGILDHDDDLIREQWEHTATARARRGFFGDRLSAQLFSYIGIDPWDTLLRPSLTWVPDDGVELSLGADIFLGDEEGRFGYFGNNDLVTAEARFYF